MDQIIIDGIQHLQLTKEEEEYISISTTNRSDLLDKCALSLFGRLLANRHQNMRALKYTLRSAWKMGSDLRIEMWEKIFSSSTSTQVTKWSGSGETALGTSTITSYSFADGGKDYWSLIFI